MKLKTLTAILAFIFLAGLNSCQKDQTTNVTQPDDQSATLSLSIPDYQATPIEISNATIDEPILMGPPMGGNMGGGMGMGMMTPFSMIIRQLKLTTDQTAQIKTFLQVRSDCQKALMIQLRDSELPIIKAANDARTALIAQAKAENWTRDSLRKALMILNRKTMDALNNNPVRATVVKGMKDCDDAFFTSIQSILSSDQLTKWNDWVARFKTMRDKMGQGHKP